MLGHWLVTALLWQRPVFVFLDTVAHCNGKLLRSCTKLRGYIFTKCTFPASKRFCGEDCPSEVSLGILWILYINLGKFRIHYFVNFIDFVTFTTRFVQHMLPCNHSLAAQQCTARTPMLRASLVWSSLPLRARRALCQYYPKTATVKQEKSSLTPWLCQSSCDKIVSRG